MNIFRKLIIKLITGRLVRNGQKARHRLDILTENPMKNQEEFLLKLLQDNKDTEYGKKYDFASILSIDEYRRRVPLTTYDDYAHYIKRMTEGEKNILTSYKVDHFSKSSGTMGNPKLIPFSDKAAKISNDYVMGSFFASAGKLHLLGDTPSLNLVESHLSHLESGVTVGSYSARVIDEHKKIFSLIQTPPPEVMMPRELMNTRYLLALYALREGELSYCICAFYSYFVEVLRFIEKHWEMLAKDIENGTIDPSVEMPEDIRQALVSKMKKDVKRANEIRDVMRNHEQGTLLVPLLWKKFRCVVGIGTAGFSTYTEKLRAYFGPDIHFFFIGVTASEGVFSALTDVDTPQSVLLPDSIFYEFKPEEDETYDNLLTIDQLEPGKNYELILTNLSGFYRYKMKDVIRVVGKYNNTPTIEFMYRANQTVNLVGEKTTEVALREVAKQVATRCGFNMVDYCMYPNPDAIPVRYEFLIEPDSLPDDFDLEKARTILDECLGVVNPSMADKLAKGTVAPSKLYFLQPETTLLYRDMMILKGVSSAQLKPVRVIDNVVKHNFYYTLTDPRFELPEEEFNVFSPVSI